MNEGIDIRFNQLPEITKNELIENKIKLIEAKQFGNYIIYICEDRFKDMHGIIITLGASSFENQEKKKPTDFNIGNIKQALKVLTVDWLKKYKRILFGSDCDQKVDMYYRYGDYFIKKYKHAVKSEIKIHPFYGTRFFIGTSL